MNEVISHEAIQENRDRMKNDFKDSGASASLMYLQNSQRLKRSG